MAADAAGLPGWDKVNKLAEVLLTVTSYVTDAQIDKIKQLYDDLEEFDRRPLKFPPRYKKAKGRFKQTKNRSAHIGIEALAR